MAPNHWPPFLKWYNLPSGKRLHSCWKWWFSSLIYPLNMVIFHSKLLVYQRVWLIQQNGPNWPPSGTAPILDRQLLHSRLHQLSAQLGRLFHRLLQFRCPETWLYRAQRALLVLQLEAMSLRIWGFTGFTNQKLGLHPYYTNIIQNCEL